MKTVTTSLETAITGQTRTMRPKALFDFDYNRIADNIEVANTNSDYATGTNEFPVNSIIEKKFTPKSGLPKIAIDGFLVKSEDGSTPLARVVDVDDVYKYYRTPSSSVSGGGISDAEVYVDYNEDLSTNKIFLAFEISYAQPSSVEVFIDKTSNPGVWVSVGTFSVDSDGIIEIYHQGGDTWSTTFDIDNNIDLRGIKWKVVNMNGQENVRCECHYASMNRVVDMSSRISKMSVSNNLDGGAGDTPIGGVIIDSLDVELENTDHAFDLDNASGDFYGLLEPDIAITASWEFLNASDVWEEIPVGVFYVKSWGVRPDKATLSVDAEDALSLIKEVYINDCFVQTTNPNMDPSWLVKEVLERAGAHFGTGYSGYSNAQTEFFWADENANVLEIINSIVRPVGGFVYVNDQNEVDYKDHKWITDNNSIALDLDSSNHIVSLSHDYTIQANDVRVNYHDYKPFEGDGVVKTNREVVWQPSTPVFLKSAGLAADINESATSIELDLSQLADFLGTGWSGDNGGLSVVDNSKADPADVFDLYPETGVVVIEGERIKYSGKSTTGGFFLTGCTRGYYGAATAHSSYNYSANYQLYGPAGYEDGIRRNGSGLAGDRLVLNNNNSASPYVFHFAEVDETLTAADNWERFGARCRVRSGLDGRAGIAFNVQSDGRGYYVEIRNRDVKKDWEHNTSIGVFKIIAGYELVPLYEEATTLRDKEVEREGGRAFSVKDDTFLDIDVVRSGNTYKVYVSGTLVQEFTDSTFTYGRYGVYARGKTDSDFKRMFFAKDIFTDPHYHQAYDFRNDSYITTFNEELQRDAIESGGTYLLEEFVPLVREVYEVKADYNMAPVKWALPYLGNEDELFISRSLFTPFGFEIMVEITADIGTIAAVNGGQVLENSDDPDEGFREVNYSFFIFGQPMVDEDDLSYNAKDDSKIRKYGRKMLTIDGSWIIGEEYATIVGDYIKDQWGDPTDVISLDWRPDPRVEIGDIVRIDYPERNYTTANHEFIVHSSNIDFNKGFSGRLSLKRKNI